MNVFITGALGFIGNQLVKSLQEKNKTTEGKINIIATDIKDEPSFSTDERTKYYQLDIRSTEVHRVIEEEKIDVVIHLASIVTPGKNMSREFQYSVDVGGTKNLLKACTRNNVRRIVTTSSGAAYGYYQDNPPWIKEETRLRGNKEFAYSYHKRLVEEILASYRKSHPRLEQVIFRVGTILGENVDNQITDLFKKRYLIGISGSESPFVFIWDQDVVACLIQAIDTDNIGIFNVAGDGALTLQEIGTILNKKIIYLPPSLIKLALYFLKRLRLTQYGEEQVNFLRYRPVLDNEKLREEFRYVPSYTSKEAFIKYCKTNKLL